MADFSLSITIPDDKVAEMIDALNWNYGQLEEDGELRDRTAAELKALVNAGTVQALKDIYKRYQAYLLTQSPVDDIIDIV